MLDDAAVFDSKDINHCKPKILWRRLAMIMNSDQVVGRDDPMDGENPVRIPFQEVFEETDDGFAAVGKSGLVLYIVGGHPAFEGLSDFFLPVERIDELVDNFTGRQRADFLRWCR